MDVVSVLRKEFTTSRILKVIKDTKHGILKFGNDQACKLSAPTNFIDQAGGFYSIESIWFLLTRKDTQHGAYLLEARKADVKAVGRTHRAFVLGYMGGADTQNIERFDPSAYVPVVQRTSELETVDSTTKRSVEDAEEEPIQTDSSSKRARVDSREVLHKPDKSDLTKKIISREVTYENRLSVLQGTKAFDHVLLYLTSKPKNNSKPVSKDSQGKKGQKPQSYDRYNQPVKKTSGEMFGIQEDSFVEDQNQTENQHSAVKRKNSGGTTPKKRTTKLVPIIVVPAGMKDMITLHNIRPYLEQGKFSGNTGDHFNKPSNVIVERKKQGVTVPYKVIDNVNGMTKDQWDRVIACFVAGPEWQFKRWPWYEESGTAGVFSRIRGFYIQYDDQPEHPNIKKWDVTKLQISRTKRHLDKTSSLRFWDALDRYSSKFAGYLRL